MNKHDYLSMAPYCWKNETTKDGFPYGFKDGIVNPVILTADYDVNSKCEMAKGSLVLCLAYLLNGDERYAKKAAEKIKTWF